MQTEFDHIVVGGGSAGCAVVAQLAERTPGQICLIEAGPTDRDLRVRVPFGLVWLMGSGRDWRRRSTPQAALGGRQIAVPRGRMLGGSGSLNSMVWFRGCRQDFEDWGLPNWSSDIVWAAFDAVEARVGPQRLPHPHPLAQAFGQVLAANDPMAAPTPERDSSGIAYVNMQGARRRSAADAFLRPAMRSGRVHVMTGVEVARVTLTARVANGVALRDGRTLTARSGVILSAGAVESPMILMRSGIGPGADLRAAGLEVQVDAPGVGANLHDHPAVGLHFAGRGSGYGLSIRQLPAWALSPLAYGLGRGRLTSNTCEAIAFHRSHDGLDRPDLQTHFIPFMLGWRGRSITWGEGYFADVTLCRPKSRGRLRLGRDPWAPQINLNLLSDPDDTDHLVRGMGRLRDLLAAAPLGKYRAVERQPGPDVVGDALRDDILNRCGTAYHPVGTLAMGVGGDAPLTPDMQVKGTTGLWVADASVMPAITSANTNAPAMMIGWRAGEIIAATPTQRSAA